jgi:hypothetical protein
MGVALGTDYSGSTQDRGRLLGTLKQDSFTKIENLLANLATVSYTRTTLLHLAR